jgi:2-oxoglutarate ferredoxin oxidoreductase subunit alpha
METTGKKPQQTNDSASGSAEPIPVTGKDRPHANRKFDIKFFKGWCKRCGVCYEFCPSKALVGNDWGEPQVADADQCRGCMLCVQHCPDFGITISERKAEGEKPSALEAQMNAQKKREAAGTKAAARRAGKALLLSGNEAAAYGALAAGATFFAGYPITPSTEVAEIMALELPKIGGSFIQMEDEIASMGAIIGASLTGAKSLTATSGPGFSLMQEHIGFAAMAEVPCVVINVMRGGPSTGLPTKTSQADIQQARYGSHGDYPIIALMPNSVRECFELTIKAFNLAEKFRSPVVLLSDETLGHMREKVVLPQAPEYEVFNRSAPTVPQDWYKHYPESSTGVTPMASFGQGYRFHVTGLTHDANGFPTEKPADVDALMEKFRNKETRNSRDLTMVEQYLTEDAEICLFAAGSVARSARQAVKILRARGVKVGLLRPQIVWPFPESLVEEVLEKMKLTLVVEMNFGQLRKEVERLVKGGRDKVRGLNVLNSTMVEAERIVECVSAATTV